jgi:hypothetical protein
LRHAGRKAIKCTVTELLRNGAVEAARGDAYCVPEFGGDGGDDGFSGKAAKADMIGEPAMQFKRTVTKLEFALLITLLILPFLHAAKAQDKDATAQLDAFRQMAEKTVLSCETLVVLDYKSLDSGFSIDDMAPSDEVPFDLSFCKKNLASKPFGRALDSFLDSLADSEEDSHPTPKPLSRNELDVLTKKRKEVALKVAQATKVELNPFVEFCRTTEPKAKAGNTRVCYFGAFGSNSGGPARAVFEAMASNALRGEALCSSDPIDRKKPAPPEFNLFLDAKDKRRDWKSIKDSLITDGFTCEKGDESEGCRRWILAVYLAALDNKTNDTAVGMYGRDFITPRELAVYKGKWFIPGPYGRLRCAKLKDQSGELCDSSKPIRGTEGGICLVPEDWHTFMYVGMGLNGGP